MRGGGGSGEWLRVDSAVVFCVEILRAENALRMTGGREEWALQMIGAALIDWRRRVRRAVGCPPFEAQGKQDAGATGGARRVRVGLNLEGTGKPFGPPKHL